MKQLRQGDLLFVFQAEGLPKEGDVKKVQDRIVERGEVTGHAHRLETQTGVELVEIGGMKFVVVADKPARVTHEEHAAVALSRGVYQVTRQREFDPLAEEERVVRD